MANAPSPARASTVAITAHLPKKVRDRLKILAVELDRTMNELIAVALDDLFAKHGKPRSPQQIAYCYRIARMLYTDC